jgi:hypothetical protein
MTVLKIRKDDPLYVLFERFSQFGNKTVYTADSARVSGSSRDPAILDGTRFVKLFKDAGAMDPKVINTTELDIIFNKVKAKNERKLTFVQFREACRLIARKKFLPLILSQQTLECDDSSGPTRVLTLSDSNETITEENQEERAALRQLDDLLLKCPGPSLVAVTVHRVILVPLPNPVVICADFQRAHFP